MIDPEDELAFLDTMIKTMSDRARALREIMPGRMGRAIQSEGYWPDGTRIATITRYVGDLTAVVVDESGLLKWCAEKHPEQITQSVQPKFKDLLLTASKKDADIGDPGVDPTTGEVLTFIEVRRGSPYVKLSATNLSRERAETAVNELVAGLHFKVVT